MTKNKKRAAVALAASAVALAPFAVFRLSFAAYADQTGTGEPTLAKTEVKVVEELDWEGDPVCGWGEVRKNLHPGGGLLDVGGKTYTENSIGTHMPEAYGAQDIVYNVEAYSAEFPYLDMYVAMADSGGVNNVNFIALADYGDGKGDVEVDRVHWDWTAFKFNNAPMSFEVANTPAQHKPLALRANISGAKKLTLRILGGDSSPTYTYGNGACAFLNVRMLKDVWDGYMPATRIYDRNANPGIGGWSEGHGDGVAFNANIIGDRLAYDMYADPVSYEDGMGVHLKNVSYADYSADKTNAGNFVSLKWDISKYDFRSFSTIAYAALGTGYHVDVWIDGNEAYTSGKIDSLGTYSHYGWDAKEAPREINVAIPKNASTFELRMIADTGLSDGMINLACPTFFERSSNKLASVAAVQTAGYAYKMQSPRTYMYDGRRAEYYDAATQTNIAVEDGIFFVAGTSYVFDVSEIEHNTIVGKLGKADFGHLETGTTPLELRYTVEYEDGKTITGKAGSIDLTTSGKDVSIYIGNNAKKLTLELYSDDPGFSEVVLAGATFTDMYSVTFDDGTAETTTAYAVGAALSAPQDPVKAGHAFGGWKKEGETEPFDFDGATVTSDMRFEAIWTVDTFEINYFVKLGDADAVSAASDYPAGEYAYDTDAQLPQAKAVEGYTFVGWYVDGSKVEKLAAESYSADIDVVAVYTVNTFTVTFVSGDTTLKTETVEWGKTVESFTPTAQPGHRFVGWKSGDAAFDFATEIKADITLEAQFAAEQYTITYKHYFGANDVETVEYSPATHTFGVDTALPTAAQVDGYIFVGWYVGDDMVEKLDGSAYTGNITLIAKYRKEPVTVVFVSDGVEYKVEYDEGQTATPKPLVRDGYEFVGWFTDEECTTEYDFNTPLDGNVTLYAKWKPVAASTDENNDGNENGISDAGLAAAIAVPICVAVAGGVAAAVVILLKKKKNGSHKASGPDGDGETEGDGNGQTEQSGE